MKILQAGKYILLILHAALFCWICIAADEALRIGAAWAGWGSGAARSLQYALLALSMIGVLILVGLLDKRFSRAKAPGELACKSRLVFMVQLFALGGAAAVPAAAGMQSWHLAAAALPAGGALLLYSLLRGRAARRHPMGGK